MSSVQVNYTPSATLEKFHKDSSMVRAVGGPVGCVAPETLIVTEFGLLPMWKIDRPMRVLSWNEKRNQFELRPSSGAFPKGVDYLYQVSTPHGEFAAAGIHQLFCGQHGYQPVEDMRPGDTVGLCFSNQEMKLQEQDLAALSLDVPHLTKTTVDFLGRYAELARQRGQQLLQASSTDLEFLPSLGGEVQEFLLLLQQSVFRARGVQSDETQAQTPVHNHPGRFSVQSCKHYLQRQFERLGLIVADCCKRVFFVPLFFLSPIQRLSRDMNGYRLLDSLQLESEQGHELLRTEGSLSYSQSSILKVTRQKVKRSYWDMLVPDTNNYVSADGTIHHNSGKSVGMVMEVLLKGMQQQAFRGVRKTRWAVVRNTYSELKNTTIKTWLDWIPAEISTVKMTAPPTAKVVIPDIGDSTRMEIEIVFLALDREEDQAKLRSFELTGIWFNEGQFLDEEIIRVGLQRTGRYPKVERDEDGEPIRGTGPSWSGAILDFNLVDTEHLLYRAFKTEKRAGWRVFLQPPAIMEIDSPDTPGEKMWVGNPDAENIRSHANESNNWDGYRYYLDKLPGMKRSQILVDFCAQWGVSVIGQPVYAETYDDEYHVAEEEVKPDKSLPVYIGVDFGLHPAIIFGQVMRDGRLVILKELDPNQPSGVSLEEFLEDWYRPFILEHFTGVREFLGWGDPAGRGRSAIDKRSPFMVLAAAGIRCSPTMTNEFLPRKEAVEKFLMKRNGLVLNPSCTRLRKGFLGGYGYKKINGLAKTHPEKNMFSHPHDALQYLALGLVTQGRRKTVTQGNSGGLAF